MARKRAACADAEPNIWLARLREDHEHRDDRRVAGLAGWTRRSGSAVDGPANVHCRVAGRCRTGSRDGRSWWHRTTGHEDERDRCQERYSRHWADATWRKETGACAVPAPVCVWLKTMAS
jgi:hypothetical protein